MEDSKFQFSGFNIVRSLIERKKKEASKKISLVFSPKGYINKNNSNFQLHLGVRIADENKAFNIEIEAIANYVFENKESLNNLNKIFYLNAPALLFPYIRAYISTLTNLSGFDPINLPTLNMSKLGEDLERNTTIIE